MSTEKATPRPWYHKKQFPYQVYGDNSDISEQSKFVCCCEPEGEPLGDERQEANASLIVKAVNSHDLIIQALNDIMEASNIKEAKDYANKALREMR